MLPGACADGGRQRNDKVKTHDDIACLLMWSHIVLLISNDLTDSSFLFLPGIFTSWGITEQLAWRQAITHLTSIIIKIIIYFFIIASENIFETFFSEQTKVGIKVMLRNKLKTMDEKVPDLEPLLQMVDHHKGDQVHDEHDWGLTIPMHAA